MKAAFAAAVLGVAALGTGAGVALYAPSSRAASAEPRLPSRGAVRASAVQARKQLWHAPARTRFRAVRATMVPGRYNGETPGAPYVGFCGEINIPNAPDARWGRPGWKPFHVSGTLTSAPGQTRFLNMADRIAPLKCAGRMSREDYSAIFNDPARLSQAWTPADRRRAIVPHRLHPHGTPAPARPAKPGPAPKPSRNL